MKVPFVLPRSSSQFSFAAGPKSEIPCMLSILAGERKANTRFRAGARDVTGALPSADRVTGWDSATFQSHRHRRLAPQGRVSQSKSDKKKHRESPSNRHRVARPGGSQRTSFPSTTGQDHGPARRGNRRRPTSENGPTSATDSGTAGGDRPRIMGRVELG